MSPSRLPTTRYKHYLFVVFPSALLARLLVALIYTIKSPHTICKTVFTSSAAMRFPIAYIWIAVLVVLAFGRATNKSNNTSKSTSPVEPGSLNDPIVPAEEPVSQRAPYPDDINTVSGAIFDPNYFAGTELWETFTKKGRHLDCLMRASDEGAGWLMQDTRHPPSAASRWKNNLPCKFISVVCRANVLSVN